MAGEFKETQPSQIEVKFKNTSNLALWTQGNSVDCVPSALLNSARILGFQLVDNKGQLLTPHTVRNYFHWPQQGFIDMYKVVPVLNDLPKKDQLQHNAFLLNLKITGGEHPHINKDGREIDLHEAQDRLSKTLISGSGLIMGFGNHASIWAPIRMTHDPSTTEIVNIDSMGLQPIKTFTNISGFNKYIAMNINSASSQGEYPIVFPLFTKHILKLNRFASQYR